MKAGIETKARSQVQPRARGKQRFRFVSETIGELRKVVWPTRQDTTYLTTLVIVATLAVALALWLIDLGFSKFINIILLR